MTEAQHQKHAGSPAPRRRPWWRRLLGAVLYLLFLAVVIEVALQAYYYVSVGQSLWTRSARPLYVKNEHTVFWNKPNLSIRHDTNEFRSMLYTNSQGLRVSAPGEEYAPGPDPSHHRILLMGPSFAYGWGVDFEQTYGDQLQRLLNEAGYGNGRPVQVINAGVPSMGPAGNLAWFRHVGKDLQPDLVILFTYGSMAVPRHVNWNDYEVDDDGYVTARNRGWFYDAKNIVKNSAMVFYGWTLWARLAAAMDDGSKGNEVVGAGREMKQHVKFSPDNPEVVEAVGFFEELRQTVAAGGAKLLIVHFPLAYGVHAEDVTRWKHLGIKDIEGDRIYNEAICTHLRGLDFNCLNITSDLIEEARKGKRLYYWLDIHWTPDGNLAAAQSTARHLLTERGASSATPASSSKSP